MQQRLIDAKRIVDDILNTPKYYFMELKPFFLYQRNQTANCRQKCRQDISAKANKKWQVRKNTKNQPETQFL